MVFSLSPGQSSDCIEGEKLLRHNALKFKTPPYLVMDKAYEGDPLRKSALEATYRPIVPPKSNRLVPWSIDKRLYKKEMK